MSACRVTERWRSRRYKNVLRVEPRASGGRVDRKLEPPEAIRPGILPRMSSRPELEPDNDQASEAEFPAGKTASGLLAWLRLMRLPNVFTALADATMGYLFVQHSLEPLDAFASIAAASGLLYTAGIVLNDVFDIEIDRQERPERPLPSGAISLSIASVFGFTLLALGVIAGWLAGLVFAPDAAAPWRSGLVATLLAALIVFYNTWLKRTPV